MNIQFMQKNISVTVLLNTDLYIAYTTYNQWKKMQSLKTLLAKLNVHLTVHIISLTSTAFPYTSQQNNLNYYCTTTIYHFDANCTI